MKITAALAFFFSASFCFAQDGLEKIILIPGTQYSTEVSFLQPAVKDTSTRTMFFYTDHKLGITSFISWDLSPTERVDSTWYGGELGTIQYSNDTIDLDVVSWLHERRYVNVKKYNELVLHQDYKGNRLTYERVHLGGKRWMHKDFFYNGGIKMQQEMDGRKKDGMTFMYYENGQQSGAFQFRKGKLISARSYDLQGNVISDIPENSRKKSWQMCDAEGKICCNCKARTGKIKCRPVY